MACFIKKKQKQESTGESSKHILGVLLPFPYIVCYNDIQMANYANKVMASFNYLYRLSA